METLDHKKISYEIPKAELHIHIEGTFEPELYFQIAKRNNIQTPYTDIQELKQKYQFENLKSFLDLYYSCCEVLIQEQDFFDLTYSYIQKAVSQGTKYAEIFFDPQTHLNRGISFSIVLQGLSKALEKANQELQFEGKLIMCFLRDQSEESAIQVLQEALPFKQYILGIGLDSNEYGNPPEKFTNVYKLAKENGFRRVCHTGEENCIPEQYFHNALDCLDVERIDHGIQAVKYQNVMKILSEKEIAITLCPLSNKKLMVYPDLSQYPLKTLLENNVIVMLNSDDPAFFGGYIGDNYYELAKIFQFTKQDYLLLAINSFKATFLNKSDKEKYVQMVKNYIEQC